MNVNSDSKQPKWSTEIGDCGDDLGTCCITCLLPCVTFGRIAEVLGEGESSCVAEGFAYGILSICSCHWLLSCVYRERLRNKFGLPGDSYSDCCIHYSCEPCALCQEYAELKHRGLDPSKGWIRPPTAPPQQQMPPSKQLW